MIIIFAGTIGRSGLGGQAWAVLQYLLGLRALGHDVYYLEDCGRSSWVYVWEKEDWTHELDYPAAYVNACLAPFGFGDRWIYRDNYRSLGMPLERFLETCAGADLIVMRATPFWTWRKEYDGPRRRAFIDVDPGFTQITLANGDQGWLEGLAKAERRFTVAQRIGAADCPIPESGGPWLKTLPPVFLPEWPVAGSAATHFTSVMRWQGFREVTHAGISYGQRDQEFPQFFDLPRATKQKFCLAQMGVDPEMLTSRGWETTREFLLCRCDGVRGRTHSRDQHGAECHRVRRHGGGSCGSAARRRGSRSSAPARSASRCTRHDQGERRPGKKGDDQRHPRIREPNCA